MELIRGLQQLTLVVGWAGASHLLGKCTPRLPDSSAHISQEI